MGPPTRTSSPAERGTIGSRSTPTSHDDDLRLVRDVSGGGSEAVARFVERMRCVPAILAAQNARLGSPLEREDLADVVQDTLAVVWTKLGDFAGRAALETWVYRFCFLELMNGVRRRKKRQAPAEEASMEPTAPKEPAMREYAFLHRGLERIGLPWADVIRLKHFEELTFDEIGSRLAISPNTAKTQYYRGMTRLRDVLAGEARSR